MRIHIHTLGVISAVQLITMAIYRHHRMQSRNRSTSALVFSTSITMPVRGRRRVAHINIRQSDARISMVTERIKAALPNFQAEGFRQSRAIATFSMAVHAQRRTTPQIHIRRTDSCHLNLYPAGTQKKCHGRHYCHANSPFHMLCYNICNAVCKYFHPSAPCFQPLFLPFFPFFQDAAARPQPKIIPQRHSISLHTYNKHFPARSIYLILLCYKVFFTIICYFSLKKAYFQAFFHIFSLSFFCRRRSFAHFLARFKSSSQQVNPFYYHHKL